MPLFLLAIAHLLPGRALVHILSPTAIWRIELLLATPVVVWGGRIFVRAWIFLRLGHRQRVARLRRARI